MNDSDKLPRISLTTLHACIAKGKWRLDGLRARRGHCFFWITRGQGRISIAGTTRGFSANTVLFVPAGLVHSLRISNPTHGYIATSPVDLHVPTPQTPVRIRASTISEQGQITGYFEHITAEIQSAALGAGRATESYLSLFNIWIARNLGRNDWPDRAQVKAPVRLVDRFLHDLEQRLQRTPTVASSAAALNVTPTHLSRMCAGCLGQPASEIIHDRLILEAKFRLADTPQTIRKIAADLGFGSATYFSRLFQRQTGMSPRSFRKSAANR